MSYDDWSLDDIFYRQLKFKDKKQERTIEVLESEIKTLKLKLDILFYDQAYIHNKVRSRNLRKIIQYLEHYLIILKEENKKMFDAIFNRSFSYNKYEEFEYRIAPSLGYRFYSSEYERFIKKYEYTVCLIKQKIKELRIKIDAENEKLLKREKKNIYRLQQLSNNSKQR